MSDIPDIAEREKRYRIEGIHPDEVPVVPSTVRTSLGTLAVIGQGCATALVGSSGLGGLALAACSWLIPWPGLLIALPIGLALAVGTAWLIWFMTRNDYRWVEIDGPLITAKHLYTGKLVIREIAEIAEVRTHAMPRADLASSITAQWLGRVKGWRILFRDGKAPLQVVRADPRMKDACLFMEALFQAMKAHAPVEAEVADIDGSAMVLKVSWGREPRRPVS